MKSERISIFNYEAFYLDHLEGNLGEEDTALLLAFLEEHPELAMEDDDFVILDPKEDVHIFQDKDSLKVVNDEAVIVLSNVEHFLIAESEGQLTPAKQDELNAFVRQHPHLEKERAYFAAMFLKADQSIVYANKSGLKRKGAIIFWPYIALAAASILIAFFFVMNNGSDAPLVADEVEDDQKEVLKQEAPTYEPKEVQLADETTSSDSETVQDQVNEIPSQGPTQQRKNIQQREQVASVNTIKHQQVRRVLNTLDKHDLQPVSVSIDPPALTITPENDYAQVTKSEMKNPIKPITSRLGKSLNKSVDFQTGKAADNAGAGFFLKIGDFEISRKKAKKKRKK